MFNECFCENKKYVKFSNINYIYLIPSLNDLYEYNLINILWWSYEDYLLFQGNNE